MQNSISHSYKGSVPPPIAVILEEAIQVDTKRCGECIHNSRCIAQDLAPYELDRFSGLVRQTLKLAPGKSLFRMGEAFTSIYTVLSGTLKIYTLDKEGQEQVLGFYLPGDLVAIDAIGGDVYRTSAEALEMTSVCEIPYPAFEAALPQIRGLQKQLMRRMCYALRTEEQHVTMLGRKNAEQRLALFLIRLSERFAYLGYSPKNFLLCMSRSDIGNYLGLAMETVSRLFSKFQELGMIRVERKAIAIEDWTLLKQAALA